MRPCVANFFGRPPLSTKPGDCVTSINKNQLQEALRTCKGAFTAAAVFSMFVNLLMLVPAFYMLQVYDRVVTSGSVPTLVMLTLILLLLLGTMGALEFVRSRILVRISNRFDKLLGGRLFDASFQQALRSGGAQSNAQPLQDLTSLRQFLTGNGFFAFFDAPWLPVYLAVMFMFHPWYGWIGVASAIVLVIIAFWNEKATASLIAEANREQMAAQALTSSNLRNAEVIESMGMLDRMRQRWADRNHRLLYWQSKASDRAGVFTSVSKVFRLSVQSLILGAGALLVIRMEITPGLMIAGSILLGRALAPIDLMIGSWRGFVAARSQYERLNEWFKSAPPDEERMALPAPQGRFDLEGAVIGPPGSRNPIIRGISMTVEPGDMVAIIGPSAAGKSTLARALLGIWPTMAGTVRLDGAEIHNYRRSELGPYVGYLPQDIELFDGTVSENIARFGEVDSTKVVAAAQAAGVHDMILRLPEGYDTVIGQAGGVLSGGQRQRIGLARALYDHPVVVVLDEPNSNLDDKGETALAQALEHLRERRCTVVIITHRRSILSRVDKIAVMNDGALTAYGPKEQVLAQLAAAAGQTRPVAVSPTASAKG